MFYHKILLIMKGIKRIIYALCLVLFVSCCNEDFVTEDVSYKLSLEKPITASNLTLSTKIHYAIAALGRIEEQLIENPDCEKVDYQRFAHAISMLDIIKQNEVNLSTKAILEVCKNDRFYNRYNSLDEESLSYRKLLFYEYTVYLLLGNNKETTAVLDSFLSHYRSYVKNTHEKLKKISEKCFRSRGADGPSYKITLVLPNGEKTFWCGGNEFILDAAEEVGIDLPYSSRCGQDYSSAARLISGTVKMDDNILLEEEIDKGYILLDVAYPTSDCRIVTHVEEELIGKTLPGVEVVADDLSGIDWPDVDSETIDLPVEPVDEDMKIAGGGGTGGENGDLGEGMERGFCPVGDDYSGLNEKEKEFIVKHPVLAIEFYFNASKATEETEKFRQKYGLPSSSLHNGICDQYRHMLWSAFNAFKGGREYAMEFGDAHESDTINPEDERNMDLLNNYIGYNIGENAIQNGYSYEQIPELVESAIRDGKGYNLANESL